MLSSNSRPLEFSSGDVPLEVARSVLTKHNQVIKRTARKRVMGFRRSDVLWNAKNNDLPRSFLE